MTPTIGQRRERLLITGALRGIDESLARAFAGAVAGISSSKSSDIQSGGEAQSARGFIKQRIHHVYRRQRTIRTIAAA